MYEQTNLLAHCSDELGVALIAVRTVIMLLEYAAVQHRITEGTAETLGMILAEKRRYTAPNHWLAACGTLSASARIVVRCTVRCAIQLVEHAISERFATIVANEASLVPIGIQGGNEAVGNGSLAAAASHAKSLVVVRRTVRLVVVHQEAH